MNSTLKIVVPIAILMAVVFGITFFAQYAPRSPESESESRGSDGDTNEPPLRFANATRVWDPPDMVSVASPFGIRYRGLPLMAPSADPAKSFDNDRSPFEFSLQDRVFPAYFEPGEKLYSTSFWFQNRNPKPVVLQLQYVSCSSCSGGRLAPLPPAVTRQLLQMTAVSCLPQGLFNGLPLGMAGPSANLQPERLVWEHHSYQEEIKPKYSIPAANDTDGWSPQWGILELQFKVTAIGPKTLAADFTMQVEGKGVPVPAKFSITFEGANAFDVAPARINVGEITANSDPRKYELVVYSSTRGPDRTGYGEPGDLSPPRVDVRLPSGVTDPGQFLTVTPPVRVPQEELSTLAEEIAKNVRKAVRVESAYKLTMQVTPKVGENRIEIGLLERDVWIAMPGAAERRVRVTGMVRGAVWLDNDRSDIDLLTYRNSLGVPGQKFRLISEDRSAKVEVVGIEGDAKDFLKASLEALPPVGDYAQFDLKLTIPPNARTGSWTGVVVLEVKGPNTQRIRIPVKGRGQL
jgi:hypothetical protein